MTDHDTTADKYLDLWNDPGDASRRKRLSEDWAADARYTDPLMAAEGQNGIAEMIAGARSQFPGHLFTLTGTPDGHGDFTRFSWTLVVKDGEPVAAGTDVVRADGAGRIAEVIGFLDGGPV